MRVVPSLFVYLLLLIAVAPAPVYGEENDNALADCFIDIGIAIDFDGISSSEETFHRFFFWAFDEIFREKRFSNVPVSALRASDAVVDLSGTMTAEVRQECPAAIVAVSGVVEKVASYHNAANPEHRMTFTVAVNERGGFPYWQGSDNFVVIEANLEGVRK